ncbi:ubiquinol-cytochrome C chaperone [Sphingomonas sp. SUN019]|uniref:ubiquinol-cytochrome C chaperone family protein n=1 Tax=Sphingomonas sp. SUN019 TaxID=2937788 RepID=UPI0021645945|nr:ubiquinol-cytochrome C chaperone family protein [Sphingomonas sp. SUN019]UVO51173.1 ubiquinol-cytochrome C chaperone [Sphingomonas sp. SUN019]
MGFFDRFRRRDPDVALPLYDAIVAHARQPHWYVEGQVPDTLDGRFDMIAAVLAMLLLRLEDDSDGTILSVQLTERFVDDMDAQVRQIGFGDMVVGKHIGRMVSMLGGRLGAYREGLANDGLDAALIRNLYRGDAPNPAAVAYVATTLTDLRRGLDAIPVAALAEGALP